MKTIIIIFAIVLLSGIAHSTDSVWVNYSSYTNHYPLSYIVIDRNNTKWIGTYQDGMYRYRGNTWTKIDTSNSPLPFQNVQALAVDSNNILWLGNFRVVGGLAGGLIKYDGQNWTRYKMSNSGICSDNITYLGVEKNNALWIGTANKLSKFHNEQWTTYNVLDNWIHCIAFDDTIKWIATTGGLARFDNVNWTFYTVSNSGLPSNYVTYLSLDSSHNLWISMMWGGVAKFNYSQNQWTIYNLTNSCVDYHCGCIYVDKQQGVWIGNSGPLIRLLNNICTFFYQGPNLESQSIYCMTQDKYHNIWFCTGGGISVFYPNGITAVNPNENIIVKDNTLNQNYPNPFNSSTNIKYSINKLSDINFYIYNVNGKIVDKIYIGKKTEGSYSVNYDAKNLGSGIYFYSLIINNKPTGTKIFVVLK